MNPPSDPVPALPGDDFGSEFPHSASAPANWCEALMGLLAARLALIQLESKDTAGELARRAALVAAACACVVFAWALLLAGAISIIAKTTGWPWDWVSVGLAALHLLAGIILVKFAKPSATPAFPVTRAEFQKDRAWIENFSKNKKSKA
ncbi:phage holin family protein [bacterium]|nr:phage holin family protein [bacterium]